MIDFHNSPKRFLATYVSSVSNVSLTFVIPARLSLAVNLSCHITEGQKDLVFPSFPLKLFDIN